MANNNDINQETQQQKQTNSPIRETATDSSPTRQPRVSTRVEVGGTPSSASTTPRGASTDHVAGSSSAVLPTTSAAAAVSVSATPSMAVNVRHGGSGTGYDLNVLPSSSAEGSSSSRRRFAKADERPAGPSSSSVSVTPQKRARGEMDAPKTEPTCSICGKKFGSWKAVFGHMRAHPEREWRGAFPPPKGDWSPDRVPPPPPPPAAVVVGGADDQQQQEELQSQLAPTLLDLARETLEKMKQQDDPAQDESSPSRRRKRRNFDLNVEPPRDSGPSSPTSTGGGKGFDLNKPPPTPPKNGDSGSGGSK